MSEPLLINTYATLRDPPRLTFAHQLNGRRDRSDAELLPHLSGFAGFVASAGGDEEMSATRFHVIGHIRRVRHHISLSLEDAQIDAFAEWALAANAISILPDGSVRDPFGAVLVHPGTGKPDPEAEVPYPPDARSRKAATMARLALKKVKVVESLPPVVGADEVVLREPSQVAARALALFLVAARAESLGGDDPIPVAELKQKIPLGFEGLTPREQAFLENDAPEKQEVVQLVWRYEALGALAWALGLLPALPFPQGIVDVPALARVFVQGDHAAMLAQAKLRPTGELLDALDETYRLHWAVRQARLVKKDPPAGIEPGVVQERHVALNWLTRFDDAEWEEVDTPT